MTPYLEYPQLLSVLLRMLNEGEGSVHIRREVLKVRCPVALCTLLYRLGTIKLPGCKLAELALP